MAVTRSVVRNVAAPGASPGATLTRVNRILYDVRLGAMFVTIFLGLYDVRTGLLRYANAGHPRPYRVCARGRVTAFGEVTGPILAIPDVREYGEAEERLAVGDRLMLYTDGVTEARSPGGGFYGHRRLKGVLARHAGAGVKRFCERVARDVDAFQAGRRQDDATVLALQRRA